MAWRSIFFLMLAILPGLDVLAQTTEVRASVDRTMVGQGEPVVYTLEIENADMSRVSGIEAPRADNLELTQRYPATQRSVSIINGVMSQTVTYRWTYLARASGAARIHPLTFAIGGRNYSTAAITVRVAGVRQQGARPRSQPPAQGVPGASTPDNTNFSREDIFIQAVPSTNETWVGGQVTVAYQLFFREGIRLRQSRLADSWDAQGFWREELAVDSNPVPEVVTRNGIRYSVITLKRIAAFPVQAGTLRIEPLRIVSEAYVPYRSTDPYGGFPGFPRDVQDVQVVSPPVLVSVRQHPAGAPTGFGGATGSYRIASRIDRSRLATGESLSLTLTIGGAGNISTLQPPDFEVPGAFEKYDPQIVVDINRSGNQITGSKTFTYVLVPRTNGTFTLPAIRLVAFDPASRQYVAHTTEPHTVTVSGAPAEATDATTATGLPVDDIAGLMNSDGRWTDLNEAPLHRRAMPLLLFAAPIALVIAAVLVRRRRDVLAANPEIARGLVAHPLARKHLRRATEALERGDSQQFYEELEQALRGFIRNRLNIPESGLTRTELDQRLLDAGMPLETRAALRELFDQSDLVRFAPVAPERSVMEASLARASRLIPEIDRSARTVTESRP